MLVKIRNLSKDINNSSFGYAINYKRFKLKPGHTISMGMKDVPDWVWELAIPVRDDTIMNPSKCLLIVPTRPHEEPFSTEELAAYCAHFPDIDINIDKYATGESDVPLVEKPEDIPETIDVELPDKNEVPDEEGLKSHEDVSETIDVELPDEGEVSDEIDSENPDDIPETVDVELSDENEVSDKAESETNEILLLSEMENQDGEYQCPLCEKTYKSARFFKIHLLKTHGKILEIDE